jgi:two-component system nitrogen regulation response regulator GlnG
VGAGAVAASTPFAALSSGVGGAGGVVVEAVDAAEAGELSTGTGGFRARALGELTGEASTLAVTGALDVHGFPMAGTAASVSGWESGLEQEALALLNAGRTDVWDVLTRRFETSLIQSALATTRGRRIEAAQKLGIGRNTITRKIQELGIDD